MFGNDPEVLKAHSYLNAEVIQGKAHAANVVIQKGQNEKVAAIIYELRRSQPVANRPSERAKRALNSMLKLERRL